MNEEIKPCPFCDSNESSIIFYYDFAVRNCDKCEMQGPPANNETLANISWNQRPYDFDMPAIVKKVQRMEAALKIFANPESWDDSGYSFYAEFPFVKGDPIKIAKQALGESCKQPE